LLAHLAGSRIIRAHAMAVPQPTRPLECSDTFTAVVQFANGGVGSLVYAGGGDAKLPKERVEGFGGGTAAVLDDFSRLELYRNSRRELVKAAQDKGHRAQIACFLKAVRGMGEAPPADTYLASTRATLALVESLHAGTPVGVPLTSAPDVAPIA
jgi:predicted dehydrogenase